MPTRSARRRLSSSSVALGAGIALALNLACSDSNEEPPAYAKVCVDQDTLLRADDANCPEDGGHVGYVPYYYPMSAYAPGVGRTVKGTAGTYSRPADTSNFGQVPPSGGFGTHDGTSGG